MGRAARWLRGLLAGGKKPPPGESGDSPLEPRPAGEKKKWGFGKSFREKGQPQSQQSRGAVADRRMGASYRAAAAMMDEDEQSKRAIAVAAATAAVAEAAVAAAQAAAAVVRLTSSGRGPGFGGGAAVGRREEWAAVKIQSAFRGYLARRALRALRGLVKLQALVRGNIVRKQAAETLRCMQALVRVQARARARRALQTEKIRSQISFRTNADPPTPEKYEQAVHVGVTKSLRSGTLKQQNASKSSSVDVVDHNRASSTGWNWLDRWMEERYWDSRESTKKSAIAHPFMDDERNAKILEVDPGKPQINHSRRSNHYHSSSTVTSDRNSHVFGTVPDSPSKDSTTAQRSVPSPSSVDMHQSTSTMRYPLEAEVYNESPHFYSASSRPGSSRRGPFTPSKSECSRSFFLGYSDYPNYMATTESSKAKVRSLSAPKQRPEFEKSSSVRRSLAHSSYAQQALAQRSSSLHAKFTNKAYPGSCRLDRLDIPTS